MSLAEKIAYLRAMHGVCVVRNVAGPGYWWTNTRTGAGDAANLLSEEAAWLDAWKTLEGW